MESEFGLNKKNMILNGMRQGEKDSPLILGVLTEVLKQYGAQVRVFSSRELKLAHCIGCFGCWLETPGFCRFKEPAYQEIYKTWM